MNKKLLYQLRISNLFFQYQCGEIQIAGKNLLHLYLMLIPKDIHIDSLLLSGFFRPYVIILFLFCGDETV